MFTIATRSPRTFRCPVVGDIATPSDLLQPHLPITVTLLSPIVPSRQPLPVHPPTQPPPSLVASPVSSSTASLLPIPFPPTTSTIQSPLPTIISVVDVAQQEVVVYRGVMEMQTKQSIQDSPSMKSTTRPRTSLRPLGSDKAVLALFTRSNSEMAKPLL